MLFIFVDLVVFPFFFTITGPNHSKQTLCIILQKKEKDMLSNGPLRTNGSKGKWKFLAKICPNSFLIWFYKIKTI